uniref:Uncharacterized protein n=1 Tax=Anguilla anguilla TaxID=7936 RepID=A0A0E9RPK3_ANGAN
MHITCHMGHSLQPAAGQNFPLTRLASEKY